MAFDLSQVRKTKTDRPPRCLIYGAAKVGKSSFASQSPRPIFIRTEDGLDAIEAEAFPVATSWPEVVEAVGTLYSEPHEYRTCVLDSADWAERLAQRQVAADQGKRGIEEIPYGKGYSFAADYWSELLSGLTALRDEKGMGVIILCHAEIKRFDDPLADAYDRYQLKLHKSIAKLTSEWADVIGFAQLEAMTKAEKSGFDGHRVRALATGRRILSLAPSAAHEGGNRYGLPDSVDLNWPAFEAALNQARGGNVAAENNTSAKPARKGNK